jgi:hypothetical protein
MIQRATLGKGAFMKETSIGGVWVLWGAKIETSVRHRWMSLRYGLNELVKRIVSSFQRFANGKQV